ncbi:hypothetical protein AF335_18205 [Streptomyces eurocidicus]|uniref:Uncharacterized protein n=1 Tax=Streptomyces eurocidicus TaxID=66423 RepID=A0A2N8NUQ1_STREU|nr:hypothetical protein [Streptomyces eurocidicus]MBB5121295.1 hypothetical protein [Streptomyces eurocidicus]MBF6055901.1 hypothetical protein [Streptomyces eurocidicus]PNE32505.1 hypothetical protein AF335_18205 [Streptomyces eurocidicus]
MNEEGRGPSAEPLLALIGEHRESIRAALDDAQHALLLTRLSALTEAPPDSDMAVRRALQGVRLALRPLPFDHPVRAALDGVRLATAPPGPTTVTDALALVGLLTAAAPHPGPMTTGLPEPGLMQAGVPEPALMPGSVPEPGLMPAAPPSTPFRDGRAPDPLLREPALSAAEVAARCGGAPPPELIRLPDPPNSDRYPEFQFPPGGGTPHPVVLQVNRLLLADIDPRGAASWWLGGNSWLGGTPASLLGRLPDHELVCAVTALVEGE